MKALRVPTISEIKASLGLPLAIVIFEESHVTQKEELGLTSYLRGPSGELWVSPSDLLIGKVCLTPPLTQKHIQALTHEGILDIGAQIEQKYWNEMRIEKEEALKEREEYLNRLFELEKDRLLTEALEGEQLKHVQQLDEMRIYFENKINELIWECYAQVTQLEEHLQIEIDSLNILWQEKLDEEINNTVARITEEFLEKLRLQEQVLVKIFTKQIHTLKWKHKCALDLERIKSKELMLQLRYKLECQNVANLMYLLCKERRKCKEEKNELENYYTKKIRNYILHIREQAHTIKRITRIKNRRLKQLNVRERCLIEILRQFQKFIYFALKASPTQGEFLLNIDKLIKFELDDYCLDKNKKIKKVSTKIFKKPSDKMVLGELHFNYEIDDYLDANLSLSSEEEFEESDVLPGFFFNERMYVREDFRDMFSVGIEMDMKHPLWNRDVEELLKIFKEKLAAKRSSNQINKIKSHHSSVHFNPAKCDSDSLLTDDRTVCTISMKSPSPPPKTPSPLPLIKSHSPPRLTPKKSPSVEDEEEEIRKVSLAGSIDYKELKKDKKARKSLGTVREKNASVPSSVQQSVKSQDFIIRPRMRSATQSRLTLARDSIILHISCLEKKSLQNISKAAEETVSKMSDEKEKLTESKPSEERRKSSSVSQAGVEKNKTTISTSNDEQGKYTDDIKSAESLQMATDSEVKATSKLLLAQDSFELIRSTIAIIDKRDKEPDSIPQEKRRSQLTFDPKIVTGKYGTSNASPKGNKSTKSTKTQHKKAAIPKMTTPKIQSPAKIVGARKTKEYKQTIHEFTEERVKSLVTLMKDNPSLIGLFTKCSK
ncbi:golgin subfamily A member 4-like [Asbolus verrucosus]|uniref:Golgin subfamily A member 4-like n=1 Tax=Asbolus verrucosus TaxID=1661398 RepID=A0A482VK75_ASBVE|nr:golgin subfamily A member 4-like [Asbolus verrucosus]